MILSVNPVQASLETFRRLQVDGVILFEENADVAVVPNSTPLLSYGVAGKEAATYPIIDANHEQAMYEAVKY